MAVMDSCNLTPAAIRTEARQAAARSAQATLRRFGIDVFFCIARRDGLFCLDSEGVDLEFSARYAKIIDAGEDPFIRHCFDAPRPFLTGAGCAVRYDELSPKERAFISDAADASGAYAGIAPFVPSRRDVRWNLLSTSWSARDAEIMMDEHLPAICDALVLFNWSNGSKVSPLSKREHQCLEGVAHGLRVTQISADLGLAPVTVEHHLRNARRKLGAKTRDQAVAFGVAFDLIAI